VTRRRHDRDASVRSGLGDFSGGEQPWHAPVYESIRFDSIRGSDFGVLGWADLPLGGGFFRLGAGLGGRRGGRSAEEACGAVPGKVCPHHGAQFDTRVPRPTPHCCGEFYASTLTWAHDSIGLSMIG
jgi:hypothetical protein